MHILSLHTYITTLCTVQITRNLNGTRVTCVWSEPHTRRFLRLHTHVHVHSVVFTHIHVFTHMHACMAAVDKLAIANYVLPFSLSYI